MNEIAVAPPTNGVSRTERLASLDALRGFDMFFITGGSAMILGFCEVFGSPKGWLAAQMRHVRWEGLTQHDTILPLFLFLMGVSWPFSLAAQEAKGRPTWAWAEVVSGIGLYLILWAFLLWLRGKKAFMKV